MRGPTPPGFPGRACEARVAVGTSREGKKGSRILCGTPSLNLPGRIQAVKLDSGDAGGLRALCALTDLELNALVLIESAEAAGLDLGVVDKDVAFCVVRGNEAEALFSVEPLDGAQCHFCFSSLWNFKSGTPRAGLG